MNFCGTAVMAIMVKPARPPVNWGNTLTRNKTTTWSGLMVFACFEPRCWGASPRENAMLCIGILRWPRGASPHENAMLCIGILRWGASPRENAMLCIGMLRSAGVLPGQMLRIFNIMRHGRQAWPMDMPPRTAILRTYILKLLLLRPCMLAFALMPPGCFPAWKRL